MKKQGLSRRDFVKFSAVGAGALALSSVNLVAAMNEKDVKWDEEFDVVIIARALPLLQPV